VEVVVDGYVTARVDGIVLGNSEEVVVDLALPPRQRLLDLHTRSLLRAPLPRSGF